MPEFAAELERLGFQTTVINPDWDPEKDKRGLPGLEALEKADVGIFFVRFLKLEDISSSTSRNSLNRENPSCVSERARMRLIIRKTIRMLGLICRSGAKLSVRRI